MPRQTAQPPTTKQPPLKRARTKTNTSPQDNNDSQDHPKTKRGWESWSIEEKGRFFDALKDHGRDFDTLTEKVGSKNYEQVRHFYYRLLKKINQLLKPESIDKKDQHEVRTALLAFWELKKRFGHKEEYSAEFANLLREYITRKSIPFIEDEQVSPKEVPNLSPLALHQNVQAQEEDEVPNDGMMNQGLPDPDKIIIQLIPRTKVVSDTLTQAGQNPRLQVNLKSTRSIAFILDYLTKKWQDIVHDPIRLYPPQTLMTQHPGWGLEDTDVSGLNVYHVSGCPDILRLEYAWYPATPPSNSLQNSPSLLQIPHLNRITATIPNTLAERSPTLSKLLKQAEFRSTSESSPDSSATPTPTTTTTTASKADLPPPPFNLPSLSSSTDKMIPPGAFEDSLDGELPYYQPNPTLGKESPLRNVLGRTPISAPLRERDVLPSVNSNSLPPILNGNSLSSSYFQNMTPSKGLLPSQENSLSNYFGEFSNDAFGAADQNDELACKSHYKFFEQSQDNEQSNQYADSNAGFQPNSNKGKESPRRSLSFRNIL